MSDIRKIILKKFFNRIKEAKRNNIKEIRIPTKELEDLGLIVHEMLIEFYNKKMVEEKEETETIEISGGTW